MISIQSLNEARQELANVKETVQALDQFVSRLERVFGGTTSNANPPQPVVRTNGNGTMPSAFIDRIFVILKDSPTPMKPKQVEVEYRSRGWPGPGENGAGNLYNNVSGALGYLYGRKKSIDRDESGYFVKRV